MAAMSPSFRIYELLNKYFKNDADAKALVNGVEQLIIVEMQSGKENLATVQDIHGVKEDIAGLRLSAKEEIHGVKEDIAALWLSTKKEIAALELSTKEEIHGVREDIAALWLSTKKEITGLELSTKEKIHGVREDISRLEITMERGFKEQLKWIILFMVGLCSLGITALKIL